MAINILKSKQVAKVAKEAKATVLSKLCGHINNAKKLDANKRIPYGYVSRQVKAMKHVCPWVTRDLIMNYYRKRSKDKYVSIPADIDCSSEIDAESIATDGIATIPTDSMEIIPVRHHIQTIPGNQMEIVPAHIPVSTIPVDQMVIIPYQTLAIPGNQMTIVPANLGSRPKGTTNKWKRIEELTVVVTKNEIALKFEAERKESEDSNKRMKKGRLLEIVNEISKNINLTYVIKPGSICQRLKRKKTLSITRGGQISPLLPVKEKIVDVIIQFARIRKCINLTQVIILVNSMINGTPIQEDLIKYT